MYVDFIRSNHIIVDKEQSKTPSEIESESSCSKEDESENRQWSEGEILQLITLYEEHRSLFKSSSVKNDKVWQMISKSIRTHSSSQCENKFKYLKSKYIKKLENQSSRKTGERAMKFDYFEQFHALFGKDPNIKPVAVASSMNPTEKAASNEDSDTNMGKENIPENPSKKTKLETRKVKVEEQLAEIRASMEKKEEAKKQRHEESMLLKKQALDTFKEYMDKLLEK